MTHPKVAHHPDSIYAQIFESRLTKGDLKKLEILEAAIKVVGADKEDWTLDSVAEELGTRRSHIVYYFKTRSDLMEAVIQLVVGTGQRVVVEMIETAKNPKEGIWRHIQGTFDWYRRYPSHAPVMLYFYYLASQNERYRRLNEQIRKSGRERIAGLLGVQPELARKTALELSELAELYQDNLTGAMVSLATSSGGLTKRLNRTTQQLVDLLGLH
ncbi:MAG: TetR/AcrR family transcriptional regulator [Deltaproteobacteria bacterium]|nr:TetR/AcrR family transcriptional regulator [Deltaproteobacteria bacterium]MBI3294958.1 TetR/AcrR family transcriptional regulator [Deltaproteobacteria bacterium]